MDERLTERARKVMQLAEEEARRLNHEHLGTEHILLGIIKEGRGVAAHVLKNLDINLKKVPLEIEKLILPGSSPSHSGNLVETPRTKNVSWTARSKRPAISTTTSSAPRFDGFAFYRP